MARSLAKLEPRHLAAIRLRIMGKDNDFICEQLNVKHRTLHDWFSQQIVKDQMAEMLDEVQSEFAAQIASGSFVALEGLVQMIQSPTAGGVDADQKLAAIREYLDRNPATAKASGSGQMPPGSINFNFSNMSDAELKAKAKEIVLGTGREKPDGGD